MGLLVRHLVGIIDPFWYLILALELGLALGMHVYGAGSFWLGLTGERYTDLNWL